MKERELLYAPWRIDYIKGRKPDHCVFCAAAAGSSERDEVDFIVHRGLSAFVIMNIYPYNNGHLMVTPRRHLDAFEKLSRSERAEILSLLDLSIAALKKTLAPEGFNLGLNQGKAAGAGIDEHLHFHVLPRWVGDANFMESVAQVKTIPQDMNQTRALLSRAFRELAGAR